MVAQKAESSVAERVHRAPRTFARRPRASRAPPSIAAFPVLRLRSATKTSTHLKPRSSETARVQVRTTRRVVAPQPDSRVDLVQQLAGLASEVFGSAISADAPLMSAGLDSIGATELSTQMASRLETELP